MNIEKIANEIRRAYATYTSQNGAGWMAISEVANRVDLSQEQLTEGIRHLTRHAGLIAIPESNQRMLTAEQHASAVWIGGQWKHAIAWQ